jgi:transcriptional regulator with XRE-family HTH domain
MTTKRKPAGLRGLREAAGLTRAELAAAAGTSETQVWRWERGAHPTLAHGARVAAALGVSLDELLAALDGQKR